MEPVLAGFQLLVLRVDWTDGVETDAALRHLLLLTLFASPEADYRGCSNIFLPELLHAVLDVDHTEPAELAVIPLPQDLDVLVGLLGCQVGQLGQQLRDETVSVADPLALLRAGGPGLHCSCRRRRGDWRLPWDGAHWTVRGVRKENGRRRLPDDVG